MSIISCRSAKSKEGFTPYQSDEGDLRQISLFSRLNLNDKIDLEQEGLPHQIIYNKSQSDFYSIGSKKRKLSEQLMNTSKVGNKTFLNRSLIGKSSLNGQNLMQMESSDNPIKKQLSENSCPVIINNNSSGDILSQAQPERIQDKPRFTKTKNLLRTISNYMHKFIFHSHRATKIIRQYFINKMKATRKLSASKSNSNQSDPIFLQFNKDSNESPFKEQPRKIEENSQIKPQEEIQPQDRSINQQISEFQKWVSELSIGNFNDYQNIWTRPHKFRALYRIICYKYYKNQAYCDIYRSRLTTKQISVSYLVQFIEGILQPSQFYRFK